MNFWKFLGVTTLKPLPYISIDIYLRKGWVYIIYTNIYSVLSQVIQPPLKNLTFTSLLGHLVVINSAAEEQLLHKLAIDNNLQDSWMGYHELFQTGDWVTVLDEPLDTIGYKPWTKGKPNVAKYDEHCGSYMAWHDHGNDRNCNTELPFFREVRLN